MQLGIPMEKALANLLRRIPSQDLDFLVTAINVQREVGGNLAEIMDVISYTIRERIRIKGDIRCTNSPGNVFRPCPCANARGLALHLVVLEPQLCDGIF